MPDALCILAKAPQKVKVKTRLAAQIGEEKALLLYRAMLSDTARAAALSQIPALWWIEGEAETFGELLAGQRVMRQPSGDLGDRIKAALRHSFGEGASRAAVIGADCPLMTHKHIKELFNPLKNSDISAIPSPDGGFCALGMAGFFGEIFEGVPWSSPDTLKVLLGNATNRALRATLLEELEDIDDLASLERVAVKLNSGGDNASATRAAFFALKVARSGSPAPKNP
ncbi:glycosyltransferase [bacterium]|nr:MAG: glycosyltransferase [bacterium]